MSNQIYVTYLLEQKEFKWQLLPEEREEVTVKWLAHLEEVGGQEVIHCDTRWSTGRSGMRWEIHKDFDSWRQHAEFLDRIGVFMYFDVKIFVGTEYEGKAHQADDSRQAIWNRYRNHFA